MRLYMMFIMIAIILQPSYILSSDTAIALKEISMKVSREQAAQNRERIVETAAQLFRERGFEGIGVADLMQEAGLTHGGFYGHFSSKEDLIAEAAARVLAGSLSRLNQVAGGGPSPPPPGVPLAHLFPSHLGKTGGGCLLAPPCP